VLSLVVASMSTSAIALASFLIFLSFSFLTFKMQTVIVFTSLIFCEKNELIHINNLALCFSGQ
jgi:hypothetical protein